MHSRAVRALFSVAVALSLLGCPFRRISEPLEPLSPPPQAMNVGEVIPFEFPADGEWHYTGIMALYQDQLLMEPVGLSDGLVLGAIEFKVDENVPVYVDPDVSIRMDHQGPLFLRCKTTKSRYFPKPVKVRITKREARHADGE